MPWSLIILEGYSRTILAGTIAPTEATWVALMVLYTACLRYGVPHTLVSDSGGAYTSNDFKAVCARLQVLWSFDRPASFRLMCVAVLLTEPLKHG